MEISEKKEDLVSSCKFNNVARNENKANPLIKSGSRTMNYRINVYKECNIRIRRIRIFRDFVVQTNKSNW